MIFSMLVATFWYRVENRSKVLAKRPRIGILALPLPALSASTSISRTFLRRSCRASPPVPASLLRTSPSSESAKLAMRLCAGRP